MLKEYTEVFKLSWNQFIGPVMNLIVMLASMSAKQQMYSIMEKKKVALGLLEQVLHEKKDHMELSQVRLETIGN